MDVQTRIARLKEKREKLGQRLNTLSQQAKTQERKRDTRRKIIIGGAVLAHLGKDPAFAASIRSLLGASVGRMHDREVIADLLTPSKQKIQRGLNWKGAASASLTLRHAGSRHATPESRSRTRSP